MTILGTNVGIDRPLPADGAIEVAFDRYLLPASVTRQSFVVATTTNEVLTEAQAAVVTYDPIARTVTLRGARQPWLEQGKLYRLFVRAVGDGEIGGVMAIDGATLDKSQARRFEFFAGAAKGKPFAEPKVDLCADVLPIFEAKCASPSCHGDGGRAAAGLVLTTPAGIAKTAVGVVARGADTTGRSGAPDSEGEVFGVGMPIVAPGNPASSWLLYKVDLAPPPARAEAPLYRCEGPPGSSPSVPAVPFAPQLPVPRAPDAIERGILGNLVTGREMPYPVPEPASYATSPLTFEEKETLRLWISQLAPGAPLPACGACTPAP